MVVFSNCDLKTLKMGTGDADCHDQSADWSRNDNIGTFSAVGDGFPVPP